MRIKLQTILPATIIMAAAIASNVAEARCEYRPAIHSSDKELILSLSETAHGINARSEWRACAYYGLGSLYHFKKYYKKAIENYDRAIGWWVSFADAYEQRGDAYAALGNKDLAEQSYKQAAALESNFDESLNARCWTRAIRGELLERALDNCNLALKTHPDDANIWQSRCFVYYRMNKYEEAISDCKTALQQRPKYSDALFVLGLSEIAEGKMEGQVHIKQAENSDSQLREQYALYGIRILD